MTNSVSHFLRSLPPIAALVVEGALASEGEGGNVVRLGGVDVLVAVRDDYGEDLGVDVGERDDIAGVIILDHVVDGFATPSPPPPPP